MGDSVEGRGSTLRVAGEKFSAEVLSGLRGEPRVEFRGTISSSNPAEVLNPFVEAVHAQLVARRASEISVDFLDLEFCNSSGFKSFVFWLEQIRRLPEAQRYRLRFISSAGRRWQRVSLLALTSFGGENVTIETLSTSRPACPVRPWPAGGAQS